MPSRWTEIPLTSKFPVHSGVYAIYVDGELSYIGQTNALDSRFFRHRAQPFWRRGQEVRVKISASRKYGDWAMRELRLIAKLNPPFNKVHRGGWHFRNLLLKKAA